MSGCVHGEIKLELVTVLVGSDLVLRVSCVSCAAQSFIREANGSRYALDHKEWVRHGPWRAGLRMGDGKFDARLHVLDTEQDSSMRDTPLDRSVGFRVTSGANRRPSRILVDVTSWGCHHTAYLKVIPYPAHEYVVCTNCWTGCALPDANNVNAKSPVYVQRTNIVGAIWWEDSGRKSSVAIPIARLVRKAVKVSTWGWQIAEAAEGLPVAGFTREGESIIIATPELFNFGGRRFGKLS